MTPYQRSAAYGMESRPCSASDALRILAVIGAGITLALHAQHAASAVANGRWTDWSSWR